MTAKPDDPPRATWLSPTVIGVLCGAAAALFWAVSLVSALHGISIGMTPLEIAIHRMCWVGLAFLPFIRRGGAADIAGVGWGRSIVLTLTGALLVALFSNAGFLLVPLGHGGVIQPSTAALGGLVLATIVFKERVLPARMIGGAALVLGLCTIGYEAVSTIGAHAILGDLAFVAAGLSFAIFGVLLKLWRIAPIRAVAITSVLSLGASSNRIFRFRFWTDDCCRLSREPDPCAGARGIVGCACDLSVHPRGGPAWRRACGCLSRACSAVHAADGISYFSETFRRCCSLSGLRSF